MKHHPGELIPLPPEKMRWWEWTLLILAGLILGGLIMFLSAPAVFGASLTTRTGTLAPTPKTTTGATTDNAQVGPDTRGLTLSVQNSAGTVVWKVEQAVDCTNFVDSFECGALQSVSGPGSLTILYPSGCYRVNFTTCSSCSGTVTYRTNP